MNLLDELELREVFFGEAKTGKSYAVLCHAEDSTVPISSVFADAFKDGSAPAEFRMIDCNGMLASGKTVAERFKLDLKSRPTIFLSGAIGEPQQLPQKHLKTGNMLVKMLKGKLEKRTVKIETTQELRAKCLDQPVCGLLLKGKKEAPAYLKDAMQKLLKEFPDVAFASIDASVLYVLNLEEHLPELQAGQPRFVAFKKTGGSLAVGGDRLTTSIAALPTNGVSYVEMSNLMGAVVSGKQTMTKISSLPVVKTRTKKLEDQEHAKRERKSSQKQRGQQDSSSTGSAPFDNDGSRDGRRAERERRRQEHREQNNVRDKTPEEIAEMERRRRERMAEEADKWNMAPEDAPEEGEPLHETFDAFEDLDEGGYVTEEADEDGEDDEDVIDLD